MESAKTNEGELTSTMGNLLSASKDEKSDASDSTPTSSTDASTTTSTSQIAADDPISSTSSDTLEAKKNDSSQGNNVVNSSPIMSSTRSMSMGDHRDSFVSEKDLLDMNITDTSTEKITENVDDIVQDLENLLGEPTTTFDFIRPREKKEEQDKELSMDLDEFSVEFQIPEEKPKEAKTDNKSTSNIELVDTQNDVNKEESVTNSESEATPVCTQPTENKDIVSDINILNIEESNTKPENQKIEITATSPETSTEDLESSKQEVEKSEELENLASSTKAHIQSDRDEEKIGMELPKEETETQEISERIAEVNQVESSSNQDTTETEPMKEKAALESSPEEQKTETKSEEPPSEADITEALQVTKSEEEDIKETLQVSKSEEPLTSETLPVTNPEEMLSNADTTETLLVTKPEEPALNEDITETLPETKPEEISSHGTTLSVAKLEKPSPKEEISETVSITKTEEQSTKEEIQNLEASSKSILQNEEETKIMQTDLKEEENPDLVNSGLTLENVAESVLTNEDKEDVMQSVSKLEDKPAIPEDFVAENAPVDVTNTISSEDTEMPSVEEKTEAVTLMVDQMVKTKDIEEPVLKAKEEDTHRMEENLEVNRQSEETAVINEITQKETSEQIDTLFDPAANSISTPSGEVTAIENSSKDFAEAQPIAVTATDQQIQEEEIVPAIEQPVEASEGNIATQLIQEEGIVPDVEQRVEENASTQQIQEEEMIPEPTVEALEENAATQQIPEPTVEALEENATTQQIQEESMVSAMEPSVETLQENTTTQQIQEQGMLPVIEPPEKNTSLQQIQEEEIIPIMEQRSEASEEQQIQAMESREETASTELETLEKSVIEAAAAAELLSEASSDIVPRNSEEVDFATKDLTKIEEGSEVPSSSSITAEGVIENNIFPDLEALTAISALDESKQNFIAESENAGLLVNDQQSFEALPTVDEIFAEQSDQAPVDLPDDNLETLLAVASLQNVCETDEAYSIPQVEDITPYPQESLKIQEERAEEITPYPQESLKIQEERAEEITPNPQESLKIQDERAEEITPYPQESPKIQDEKIESLFDDKDNKQDQDQQKQGNKLKEPLVINVEDVEKDRAYSPKVTIKPIKPPEEEVSSASSELESSKGSLKMTITKQADTMHSILKIYDPESDAHQLQDNEESQPEPTVPKLIIKPIVQPEQPQSPKMSTRSSKVFSPSSQRSASPRITIKPIVEPVTPVKITIKPVLKPEERQRHSPKLTIKPIVKPEDEPVETKVHSPRVTIKPIVKPQEEVEQSPSPRITIKPIVKPETSTTESISTTPRVTIKPVVKPQEKEKIVEVPEQVVERSSPKITIKPIIKPQETETAEDFEDYIKERIVLKINKGNIPSTTKESRKRELPQEEEKSEKLAKIKLKFSKEGGHPHIVQDESPTISKRSLEQPEHDRSKRQKTEATEIMPGITLTPIASQHSKLKEMLSCGKSSPSDRIVIEDDDDDVTIIEDPVTNKPSPIVISEESNQDSMNAAMDMRDPISEIPVFAITPESVKTLNPQPVPPIVEVPVTPPAPRKRGRPRKVPLQVREDFKDPKEEEPKPVIESTRPKRSCRGQSVRTTLGIKPRKPRGGGRGRGSKRGMGTRSMSTPTPPPEPVATPPKPAKEAKVSAGKAKLLKEETIIVDKPEERPIELDDVVVVHKSPQSLLAPPQSQIESSTTDRADIVMYEEETRMSAETSSRAQTPAKQVVTSIPSVDLVEESQSSVQSSATTESVKVRKGPRLEVHQEPEGAVISADQLAEYYWSGGGPYMLQEQVAQFLGIKSFKRKYPNIPRRVVDMQERDFIRESGLAGEAMCDLGLTAVNSTDILDIMYSDFQDKYEEYCKHQRDRQAKDLTNKQKALSLAASQEKTKMDITQQAVQSAASWNSNFNKARKEQRKACMDLQTLTVHYPKGKMKQISKPKLGHYPVALVPGQFTDYYMEFTPTEINNLPLNTLCYDSVPRIPPVEMECESQTDGSGSDSDTSTSDSDSSYTGSSDEDCTLCNKTPLKRVAAAL